MTELWIKKSTTDVHRKIDNKLPKGSVCSGVTMIAHEDGVEEFTAIINGEEVNVEGPPEASADEIADEIVAGAPAPHPPPAEPATTQNAQVEGAEITEADEATGGPVPDEYEYDDSEDDDEEEYETDEDVNAAPKPKKPKSKTKKKK